VLTEGIEGEKEEGARGGKKKAGGVCYVM